MIGLFFFVQRMRLKSEAVSCRDPNEYTVKDLMVPFYLQFSVFWAPVCWREKCGLGESERQHHPRGVGIKATPPILRITVLKPRAVSEHTAFGRLLFLSGLLTCESVRAEAECFWHGRLFLADIYKFTTFLHGDGKIICAPRVGDELCVLNMKRSAASF